MGKRLILMCCFAAAVAVTASFSSVAEDPCGLNIHVIGSLFEERLNEDGFPYELKHVEWHEGSFRGEGAREALVSFYDGRQCHAAGYSELWLLRYEGGWRLDEKIADADTVEYKLLDVEGDGLMEVWITAGGGNQGYFTYSGKLVTFSPSSYSILYSNTGEDNTGAIVREGLILHSHEMGFWDIDGDGVLEVLDLEEKRTACSRDGNTEISSQKQQTVYRLVGGEFREAEFSTFD